MAHNDASETQALLDALSDPDCRDILRVLDEPLPAKEVAAACDLPQTSTYRKLEQLSEAELVAEETEVRADGHHATAYVRDCGGVFVGIDADGAFEADILPAEERPSDRLALLWSRVSEEL
ncbi:ArsR family transcriptional regulator [Haloarcula sp. CBA1130]|uniref:winged helix-turn-helix domain-containing protein n=1 Tax=unclassified Haloarcula TaxID=2624677 RepID=UPI0012466D03|nr:MULTISPECIES: helix-turn-helix domain-containing protein [unclassified Haloarcula]KAA9397047.1 ArsR family transcriptional regulator [Haloarcula sp. CBA1129]KAA9402915.1 ArsR family transcriptional regulator [Haloarcula sp. CBA1130]